MYHPTLLYETRWIDTVYIRQELWDRSLTDAAPVTRSLVFSVLFGCLDVYCDTGFTLCRTFCSTDWVIPPAG